MTAIQSARQYFSWRGSVVALAYPHDLRVSPDGKEAYVANQGTKQKPGKTVSEIYLQARKVATTLQTGAGDALLLKRAHIAGLS